jgi:hypothetical protein
MIAAWTGGAVPTTGFNLIPYVPAPKTLFAANRRR